MPACALSAQKNFVLHHSRPDERVDQVRNDVTMRCIVFTLCSQCQALGQALVLCRQGRGGWLVVLDLFTLTPPCGLTSLRSRCASVIGDSSIQRRVTGTRHAEYLLDTTVAQAHTGFKAVSTGWRADGLAGMCMDVGFLIALCERIFASYSVEAGRC